jgi:hypothetical protein
MRAVARLFCPVSLHWNKQKGLAEKQLKPIQFLFRANISEEGQVP